ncbi:hypothetical protein G9A89_006895 [Geosiphon pyriformis]|nr:hypothetical protein G9A89_006895 [Geosiphon pyriformis]
MSSNRNLGRLPARLALTSKQLTELSFYPRHPICTSQDLLSKTELELVECCDWDFETVREVQKKCARWIAPKSVSVLDLLGDPQLSVFDQTKNGTPHFFTTTLEDLDYALGGGIPCSSVTEIVGAPRCGKTQFCLTLSVQATLPVEMGGLAGGVCFIDTEGSLSANRLVEIAESRFPQYFSPKNAKGRANLENTTKSIHIMEIKSSKDVLERLKNLQEFIIMNKIRLIIVDSIGSLVRKEYNNMFEERKNQTQSDILVERNNLLVKEAALLKFLAESFHLPVIVTNQLVYKYTETFLTNPILPPFKRTRIYDPDTSAVLVTAALGNTWAHSVTTRLIFEFCQNDQALMRMPMTIPHNIRKIRIAKSPIAPNATCYYFIDSRGIIGFDASLPSEEPVDIEKENSPPTTSETVLEQSSKQLSRTDMVADWFITTLWAS